MEACFGGLRVIIGGCHADSLTANGTSEQIVADNVALYKVFETMEDSVAVQLQHHGM